MKKLISIVTALLMLVSLFSITAFAADAPKTANVYVTVADNTGKLSVTAESITVTDKNGDGKLDIDETLFAAHEAKYEGKAAAGYESYVHTQYGLSLKKLWGDESGNFGYYVNNKSAWSLADEVKDGDYVYAFVYSKMVDSGMGYEVPVDEYSFFDVNTATATQGGEVALTLYTAGFDADWNPIDVPVKDATITLNGVATTAKTNAEGKATVKLPEAGKVVISATSDTQTLVPPVCVATVASTASVNTYVTISDKDGKLVLAQEKITVTDTDKDGYLTLHDALYSAHEAKFEGGAAAGYGSAYTPYGLSLIKLWGDTSGSFGYYVNNKSAWSLADTVKEGDYINAFVYTDLTAWSDTYSFFDKYAVTATEGEEITLTLSAAGYDADYNPITVPVEDATITLDGKATEYKTDANGKVVVKIDKAGSYVISAASATATLVPPALTVTVNAKAPVADNTTEDNNVTDKDDTTTDKDDTTDKTDGTTDETVTAPPTGENFPVMLYVALISASAMALVFSLTAKKKVDEK